MVVRFVGVFVVIGEKVEVMFFGVGDEVFYMLVLV